jgi:type IV pilus assembly protein PilQ
LGFFPASLLILRLRRDYMGVRGWTLKGRAQCGANTTLKNGNSRSRAITILVGVCFLNAIGLSPNFPGAFLTEVRADEGTPSAENTVAVRPDLPAVPNPVISGEKLTVDEMVFKKTDNDAGYVLIGLSDAAGFVLRQAAPSEYVVRIPGAELASESVSAPKIAPKGFPGIRSSRAVEKDGQVTIRMFVDQGVQLQAYPRGSEILIEALANPTAKNPNARAQMGDDEEEGAEEEDASEDNAARMNPTGIRSADGSKIYTGRLISLDLQDTDIDNALRIIAEVSNLNIIASDDVSGKVTLRLIDVPWDQALDVILKTNGLDQVTEGNVIRIAPVDKLRQEREALREAKRAAENLEDLTVQYVRVSYARVGEMIDQVQSVLSERGSVAEDERTNQLIIKDIKKGHEQAIELIKRLDLRTPQVLMETQIVEGTRNILRDLGFQWNFTYVRSPANGNATGLNFPNSIDIGGSTPAGNLVSFPAAISDSAGTAVSAILDSADGARSLAARLSALETEGQVRIISRPQIATVNNKTAEIKSVETIRVRLPDSGTSVATGSGATAAGGGRTAFEEIDVGIELTVTPQASPDYYVLLDVEARSSSFGSSPPVDGIPSTLEREATSTILVKSGQTFALGGVYRLQDSDSVDGVPWLKDIPVLGALFRRTFISKSDEELIFFITPHIVEGSFDPSLM